MGLDQVSKGSLDTLRKGWIPTAILLPGIAFEVVGSAARSALRFDRTAIVDHEYWRLVSGHFVHLGWTHLALNGVGLVLVSLLVGRNFSATQWLVIAVVAIAGIDGGLWYLDPDLAWYVGLSGLLHGLLAAGLLPGLVEGNVESRILGILLASKIAWEQFFGSMPGSAELAGGDVVTNAHLYGVVSGVVAAAVVIGVGWRRPI